jgi:integrase
VTRLEQEIGSIRGSLVVNDVLPRSELGVVFGEAGYSVVIDRGPGEVLFHSETGSGRRTFWPMDGLGDWRLDAGQRATLEGVLSYSEDGVDRVLLTVTISLAFVLLTRRATASLLRLSEVAGGVSRGKLDPVLRHTAATLRLVNGEHPKVVQELLGHASITLTMDTCSHVLPGMQEESAARLDALLAWTFSSTIGS